MDTQHHEVLVVGGGNGGVSAAARLLRDGAEDVALVGSDSPVQRLSPAAQLRGRWRGGSIGREVERSMRQVLPAGCTWIEDAVVGRRSRGARSCGHAIRARPVGTRRWSWPPVSPRTGTRWVV